MHACGVPTLKITGPTIDAVVAGAGIILGEANPCIGKPHKRYRLRCIVLLCGVQVFGNLRRKLLVKVAIALASNGIGPAFQDVYAAFNLH